MSNQNDTQESEVPQSRLLVVFENLGSAHFSVSAENVTPMQLLGLAAYLEFQGKQGLLEQKIAQRMESENRPKIVVPEGRLVRSE